MNDRQLRTFVAVVDCGSFKKAEAVLFLTAMALKKQVDSLEEEIGVQLLVRTNRGVAVTPAGETLYTGAKNILRAMSGVVDKCRNLSPDDTLIRFELPSITNLALDDVISEFAHRFPNIGREITFRKYVEPENMVERVLNGATDIAESILRPQILKPGIGCQKITALETVVLVSKNHPLAKRREVRLEDLAGMQIGIHLIMYEEMADAIREKCTGARVKMNDTYSPEFIINICYNQGVYIAKSSFANTTPSLIAIPLVPAIWTDTVVIYRDPPSFAVTKFLDVLKDMYPESE